jgi:hypothetical protein
MEVWWGWWSEQERTSKMCVCKRKSKCVRNSRMCSESTRRWDCTGARAGTPTARVAARRGSSSGGVSMARAEDGSWGKSYGGGRPESDTWVLQGAGGGADRVAAMASGGARRLGQTTAGVARREEASAGSGKAAARQGRARGPVQDGTEAAGLADMAGQSGGCAWQRNGGGREVDERGPGCNF